jgi:glycosyltransferase involved in cell wall biosynthesis
MENPNFKLIVIDDRHMYGNIFLNHIYEFMQSIRFIHILFEYMSFFFQVVKLKKKADFLFITHHFKYGLFAVLMSSLFKIPFIVPILGWAEMEYKLSGISKIESFIRLKYEFLVLKEAKCILSSYDLIREYSRVVKNKNKFLGFYTLIDTDRFTPMQKSTILSDKLGVGNKKVIFTAAPLWGVKGEGIKMLLNAFTHITNGYNNVILLIAGDGRERKELEDLAKNLGVKKDVIFLGYCSNMPELMNLADVFALIFSFGGGLGFALLEAMACGKPCVVSRTSGTKILKDGEEVLLASLDPKDIADKIILLLKDEEYARQLGINARRRIEKDFSLGIAGEKLFNKLTML